MSLRHDLVIPPDDPFKNDKLKREEEAKTLTKLVQNYSDGFVLAINNEWGAGKTTFVKMWQLYLKREEVESLYFNAWENDYQEDVLVALLSELNELKDGEKKKFKDVVTKAGPLAGKVALSAIKGLVATYGLDKVLEGAIKGVVEGSEDLLKSEIDAYSARKEGLKDFQKSLEDYAKAVSGENPLVFIIDELDRCRPSYAVEVLEQVKHIFSVPGIVFVLAIDKVQLGHAVKGVYGSPGMDDVEYLRRFIDVEFTLPKPRLADFTSYLYEHFEFNKIFTEFFKKPNAVRFGYDLLEFITILAEIFYLELRQLERLMAHLKVVFTIHEPTYGISAPEYILMTLLKMKRNSLYQSIKDLKIGEQELINELATFLPTEIGSDSGWTVANLSFAYNNELKYNSKKPEALIIKDPKDVDSLRLNYGRFNAHGKFQSYFESMGNRMVDRNLRTGVIISHLELTEKYFKEY